MTNQEAIAWIKSIKNKYIHGGDDDFDEKRKKSLDLAIKALKQTRWIPVSERLPKEGIEVLITTKWDNITIGEMFCDNDWVIYEGTTNADIDDIKAWMPLPQPYTESEEEE